MNKTLVIAGVIFSVISGQVNAFNGTVTGGQGLGPEYLAYIVPDKKDTRKDQPALVLKTGDVLGETTTPLPTTKSMGWSDPAADPNKTNQAVGWTHNSRWVLIDLNKLRKQGMSAAWVKITLSRLDDGVIETPSNDDLIPGVTVFKGYQNVGTAKAWYPNTFQAVPNQEFWGKKLQLTTPFSSPSSPGYATAYGAADETLATVLGQVKLKNDNNNYLSVAVGGNANHASPSDKHDVNFKLEIEVKARKPAASSGG